jgi:hypothetical protein
MTSRGETVSTSDVSFVNSGMARFSARILRSLKGFPAFSGTGGHDPRPVVRPTASVACEIPPTSGKRRME